MWKKNCLLKMEIVLMKLLKLAADLGLNKILVCFSLFTLLCMILLTIFEYSQAFLTAQI